MAALGVVPASRVAMDTSSLLIAFGPLLTFKAPAPKLIISDEFNDSFSQTYQNTLVFLTRVCSFIERVGYKNKLIRLSLNAGGNNILSLMLIQITTQLFGF